MCTYIYIILYISRTGASHNSESSNSQKRPLFCNHCGAASWKPDLRRFLMHSPSNVYLPGNLRCHQTWLAGKSTCKHRFSWGCSEIFQPTTFDNLRGIRIACDFPRSNHRLRLVQQTRMLANFCISPAGSEFDQLPVAAYKLKPYFCLSKPISCVPTCANIESSVYWLRKSIWPATN